MSRKGRGTNLVGEGLGEHVLVVGAGEVGIDELAIVQRLAHNPAHKLEKVQVAGAPDLIILHNAVGVGLEGGAPLWQRDEQRDVWVEDLPSHDRVPLPGDTARVDALLPMELHRELGPHLTWGPGCRKTGNLVS